MTPTTIAVVATVAAGRTTGLPTTPTTMVVVIVAAATWVLTGDLDTMTQSQLNGLYGISVIGALGGFALGRDRVVHRRVGLGGVGCHGSTVPRAARPRRRLSTVPCPGTHDQLKTTVRSLFRSTRLSACHFTARASTRDSHSSPARTRSSGLIR